MKRFISFSGGVESTAMCLLYGKGATAIFCDTGSEHEEMYRRIDYVGKMLHAYHDGDFELLRIRALVPVGSDDDRVEVDSLTDYILKSKFFPSPKARFCTRLFKIAPIDKFLSSQGECELMIGLNADEADARTGNHGLEANVKYTYPLVDDGYGRGDCIELIDQYGLAPNFPAYMQRGGCIFCPYKSKKEYTAMFHLALKDLELVAKIEETIQDDRDRYFRIRSNMPKMRDFMAIEKGNIFGDLSQYYENDDKPKSCGVFCHR
jgi:3'-phosphoadenosine 5'-phosphosulfate sulfotransferase (PAPS reductase)/FAD synthetase